MFRELLSPWQYPFEYLIREDDVQIRNQAAVMLADGLRPHSTRLCRITAMTLTPLSLCALYENNDVILYEFEHF
jgi:hypothetical protein